MIGGTPMEHLIESVRSEPCLYDPNHPEYTKKTIKQLIWAKIAKETNYKSGQLAKEAWLKLRNCHRDAIRRRNKLFNSGCEVAGIKFWKYEKHMEFLVPYMANRPTTLDVSECIEPSTQDFSFIQTENLMNYPEVEFVAAPQQNDTLQIEGCSGMLPQNTLDSSLIDVSRDTLTNKIDLDSLISRTLSNHDKRTRERVEKCAFTLDGEDDLQQFFITMYSITKKMPALSQHKLKRSIFNLVSDEEEYLLKTKNDSYTATITPFDPGATKPFCGADV